MSHVPAFTVRLCLLLTCACSNASESTPATAPSSAPGAKAKAAKPSRKHAGAADKTPNKAAKANAAAPIVAEIPLQLPFEGKARAGAVYVGKTEPGVRLRLGRRRLRVGEEGHFLFAFGPYAKGVYRLKMRAKDRAQETEMTVAKRQYGEEAIDGLPEDEVDLDKGTKKELRQWRRKISKARRISRLKPDWASLNAGFRLPLKGRVTGVYGTRRTLNGKKNQRHWGIDLAARVGKKVRAPAPGVVVFAAKDIPLSGSLVIVDHGHGLSSSFLHLSRIQVREGQTLRTGQILGRVGSTGRATGAHLDWRMNWRGLRVDPVSLLNPKALSYLKRHGLAEEP